MTRTGCDLLLVIFPHRSAATSAPTAATAATATATTTKRQNIARNFASAHSPGLHSELNNNSNSRSSVHIPSGTQLTRTMQVEHASGRASRARACLHARRLHCERKRARACVCRLHCHWRVLAKFVWRVILQAPLAHKRYNFYFGHHRSSCDRYASASRPARSSTMQTDLTQVEGMWSRKWRMVLKSGRCDSENDSIMFMWLKATQTFSCNQCSIKPFLYYKELAYAAQTGMFYF